MSKRTVWLSSLVACCFASAFGWIVGMSMVLTLGATANLAVNVTAGTILGAIGSIAVGWAANMEEGQSKWFTILAGAIAVGIVNAVISHIFYFIMLSGATI